jgi:adenylate cyclase class 2
MLEVEVRYRVNDFAVIRQQLAQWGASPCPERLEIDHYFNAPHRDFRVTDEALRLRQIGERNWLTYKGPRRDTQTKTRPEIEVRLAEGDLPAQCAEELLVALGFRFVGVVRKRRQVYRFTRHGFPMELCWDQVHQVGTFVELEILTEEDHYPQAQAALLQTAAELGLQERVWRSYLQMVLEAIESQAE